MSDTPELSFSLEAWLVSDSEEPVEVSVVSDVSGDPDPPVLSEDELLLSPLWEDELPLSPLSVDDGSFSVDPLLSSPVAAASEDCSWPSTVSAEA